MTTSGEKSARTAATVPVFWGMLMLDDSLRWVQGLHKLMHGRGQLSSAWVLDILHADAG